MGPRAARLEGVWTARRYVRCRLGRGRLSQAGEQEAKKGHRKKRKQRTRGTGAVCSLVVVAEAATPPAQSQRIPIALHRRPSRLDDSPRFRLFHPASLRLCVRLLPFSLVPRAHAPSFHAQCVPSSLPAQGNETLWLWVNPRCSPPTGRLAKSPSRRHLLAFFCPERAPSPPFSSIRTASTVIDDPAVTEDSPPVFASRSILCPARSSRPEKLSSSSSSSSSSSVDRSSLSTTSSLQQYPPLARPVGSLCGPPCRPLRRPRPHTLRITSTMDIHTTRPRIRPTARTRPPAPA